MQQPLLEIDNLSIAFQQQGQLTTVVKELSLSVNAGETLALVGESGSGKSVSALSILRLLPEPPACYPTGDIRFHGESLLHASERSLRGVRGNRIAMIFQEPMVSLNPLHNLEKQLYEVLSLHRGMRKEAARGEILDCLDRVGIRNAAKRLTDFPHQLSGGERQRVMIAMALLTRHHRAGCFGTGANPPAFTRTARRAEHGNAVYHPQPQHRAQACRSRCGHAAWPLRRTQRGGGALCEARASVHP